MSPQMLTCMQASIIDKCSFKVLTSGVKFKLEIYHSINTLEVANGPGS